MLCKDDINEYTMATAPTQNATNFSGTDFVFLLVALF
jgi:hypothetical protein